MFISMQDPVPQMAKFGTLYSRPGHRVLVNPQGDMLVRPTPLDIKLNTACKPSDHCCSAQASVRLTACHEHLLPESCHIWVPKQSVLIGPRGYALQIHCVE